MAVAVRLSSAGSAILDRSTFDGKLDWSFLNFTLHSVILKLLFHRKTQALCSNLLLQIAAVFLLVLPIHLFLSRRRDILGRIIAVTHYTILLKIQAIFVNFWSDKKNLICLEIRLAWKWLYFLQSWFWHENCYFLFLGQIIYCDYCCSVIFDPFLTFAFQGQTLRSF